MAQEKKKQLEKRLQDVSGQLNNKKPTKKGTVLDRPFDQQSHRNASSVPVTPSKQVFDLFILLEY